MEKGRLLRLRECAEITGNTVATWRAWVLRRKVAFYKIGRSVRVSEADLARLLEAGRIPAREVRE
jgi:excisionase family DNA binding protein